MMDMQYVIEHGDYVLYDMSETPSRLTGNRTIHLQCSELGIAFDRESGTLHKHGDVARVTAWADKARQKLRAAGALEMANAIVVLSGKLPLEEVNKCLAITGYCRRLLDKLQAQDAATAEEPEEPEEPEDAQSPPVKCDDCGRLTSQVVGCPDGAEICQSCFDHGAH